MQLTEGLIIAEHYKLLRQLGHGSFGDVWLAHHELADMDVAIKFYGTLDSKGLDEFRNEFKIAYKLRHPNLLNISQFDVYNNCPYLVMPYCAEGSVSRMIGNMPESEIWKFVLDVSGGLAFLHSQQPPIVHQDIKPDNILLTEDGKYVISDFGISRNFRSKLSRTNNNSSSSGTIAYMGPERFSENPVIVLASDIWAFGMTLYELMTGDVLWEGMGGCVQLNGARIPIIGKGFSPALIKLTVSCLAAETWNRPTAVQIQEYATAYLQHRPLPPLPIQEPDNAAYAQPSYVSQPQAPEIPNRAPTITTYQTNYYQPSALGRNNDKKTYHLSDSKKGPQNKQALKRWILIGALFFCSIVMVSGFVMFFSTINEEQDFLSCKTKQDYEQFIKDHPSSDYVEKAQKRIAELTSAETAPTIINQNPTGHSLPERQLDSPKPTPLYTSEEGKALPGPVPVTAPRQRHATNNTDDQFFYRCNTAKDYHNYLTRFPNGKHRTAAENALSRLVNQSEERAGTSNRSGDIIELPMRNNLSGTAPVSRGNYGSSFGSGRTIRVGRENLHNRSNHEGSRPQRVSRTPHGGRSGPMHRR